MLGLKTFFATRTTTLAKADNYRTLLLADAGNHAALPDSLPGITATPATEAWLDARAQDLNGEWTVARLAGLSREEGRSERRYALSALSALDELRLRPDPQGIYMDNSVQVLTMEGTPLGRLEPAAAALFHEQSNISNVVRAYVYETQWTQNDCTGMLMALVTWLPFQKT